MTQETATNPGYPNEYVLDLHDMGYWMARWHRHTFPIGNDKVVAKKIISELNSLIKYVDGHTLDERPPFSVSVRNGKTVILPLLEPFSITRAGSAPT